MMNITPSLLMKRKQQQRLDSPTSGFTVVEVLVVALMVGVLAVLSGAGYVSWLNRMRVNAARDVVLNVIRDAQIAAKRQNATWQVSFRQNNGRVQWAVHYADPKPENFTPAGIVWQTIEQSSVEVVSTNTTLKNNGTNGPWRVQFDYKGKAIDLGKITLSNPGGVQKRCAIVKTLLGVITTDEGRGCEL